MNRTGLFIALALALVVGLLFGIYPELDLKLAALFYDPATKSFPLKFNTPAAILRDVVMWISWGLALPAIVALVIKLVRPDRPLLVSGRAIVFLLVTLHSVRGHSHQSRLQELLGPAAAGGGDAVQWRHGLRAVVGSARRLRAKLFVLLRRGRHRLLDLRARSAGAAGVAAAGLCRRDAVRRHHQRAADGVWRALFYRCCGRRTGDISGDLAGLWRHLPLAPDPVQRRTHRRRADAAGLARLSPFAGWRGRDVAIPSNRAIKRVPRAAKFDIRALNARNIGHPTDWKLDEYDFERPAQRGKKSALLSRAVSTPARRCCG